MSFKIIGQPFLQSRMLESKQMSTSIFFFAILVGHDRCYGHVLFHNHMAHKEAFCWTVLGFSDIRSSFCKLCDHAHGRP